MFQYLTFLLSKMIFWCLILLVAETMGQRIDEKCECGRGNPEEISFRIISGQVAYPHSFPWAIYMMYNGRPYCGGTLINDRYVLTAGHCVYKMPASGMSVKVGAHDMRKGDGRTIKVQYYKLHPGYTRHQAYDDNDIALVKLADPLQLNTNVSVICLPNPNSDFTQQSAVIAGWGYTQTGAPSRFLMMSRVRIRSDLECKNSKSIGAGYSIGTNLCAYGYKTDTCQGDSGSSMMYESSPYKYEVAGVVSWGDGCATEKIPGVYTKVTAYLEWIVANTKDGIFCRP